MPFALFLSRLVTDAMMRRCTMQLNYFITMYLTSGVWPPLWCILGSIRLLSMGPAKPTAQGPGKRSGYTFWDDFLHFPNCNKAHFQWQVTWFVFWKFESHLVCFLIFCVLDIGDTWATKMFSACRFALPVLTGRSFVWLRCVDYILSFMLMNLRSSSTTTRLGWEFGYFIWFEMKY